MTERTTQEQWAREDCDESPSVWPCPMCGELYSEADARLGKDGRAECPYCEDEEKELERLEARDRANARAADSEPWSLEQIGMEVEDED